MDGQYPEAAAEMGAGEMGAGEIAVDGMPAQAAIGGSQAISTWFFAMAVAVVVLNLFSAQPLVDVIGPAIGLAPSAYGMVSMLTSLGYAAGLILLVPMVDLAENRRLILQMLVGDVLALTVAATAQQPWIFLAASFALGMTMSVIQMLVPLAASLTPETQRGRVVGNIMSGLMLGIMLSRPLASLVAEYLGWRSVYGLSAGAVALLVVALALRLPQRRPAPGLSYAALIGSLWTLMRSEKVLRLRAATAGLCFCSFSLFWTAIALRLHATPFHLTANGLAAFALVGVGGIVMAPLAGRLGDRGWGPAAAVISDLLVVGAMALAWLAGSDGLAGHPTWALGLMVAAALLLDLGVVGDQTLGRRAINLLNPAARGRLNGLFTGSFFIGGAWGSLAAGAAWVWAGWSLICLLAMAAGAIACLLSLIAWVSSGRR